MHDGQTHNPIPPADNAERWVVKLGGSLLDLDDLGQRLRNWLDRTAPRRTALVIGGGATTDIVREFDRRFRLGDVAAHWLALRALSFNSHLLSELLPGSEIATTLTACESCWNSGRTPILDPFAFLTADEGHPDGLPHNWDVTSDSVAARLADLIGAKTLVLLKSRPPPPASQATDWAACGLVDPWFPQAIRRLSSVRVIDFRNGSERLSEA